MKSKDISVTVIIPNWNGRNLLKKNLPFVIAAKKNKSNKIEEVIVVDDASSDESFSFLRKNFKNDIKLIRNKKNRGFAKSVNSGVWSSKTSLVCLLNTDVLPSRDFLKFALPHFKDEKVFGVTLHEKGYGPAIANFAGGFLNHFGGMEGSAPSETFWVSGGSGVFRRSVWKSLGGFDESTLSPFYWEDVDISYRASKRGFGLLWEPKTLVFHKHEGTTSEFFSKRYLDLIKQRNQLLFIWKNITSQSLIRKHIIGLFKRALAHPGYVKVVLAALTKRKEVARARKKEIRESTVSDEAILEKFKNGAYKK